MMMSDLCSGSCEKHISVTINKNKLQKNDKWTEETIKKLITFMKLINSEMNQKPIEKKRFVSWQFIKATEKKLP